MYVSPQQDVYEVGTVVTCVVDANPPATVYWQSMDTLETWNSDTFTIPDYLVGTNRMRCHAENNINGVLYYNDLLVIIEVSSPTV